MPLTPEDVANKRFRVTRMKAGYDEEEVDAFLDEVEAELRRLLGENDALRSRQASAPEPASFGAAGTALTPAPPPPPPSAQPAPAEGQEAALRTLLLAQRTADQVVAEARAEAADLLRKAQEEAAAAQRELSDRRSREMANLVRERQDLETMVEGLRGFEREYRTRLRAYLQSQLRDLEGRQVEPQGGPPPGRPPGQMPAGAPAAGLTAASRPALAGPGAYAPGRDAREADPDTTEIDERRDGPPTR